MPTYTYKDIENGEMFEYKQSMSEEALEYWPEDVPGYDKEKPRKVKRVIGGGTGFILKGSGWYKTDYAGGNSASTSSTKSESSSTESSAPSAPASAE